MDNPTFEDEKKSHLLKWVQRLKDNPEYQNTRFKILNVGYPPFIFSKELLDIVDENDFLTIEKERIPLFIGSQFGVRPKIQFPYYDNIIIAILSKSLLSGHVACLAFYKIIPRIIVDNVILEFDQEKIIVFSNDYEIIN